MDLLAKTVTLLKVSGRFERPHTYEPTFLKIKLFSRALNSLQSFYYDPVFHPVKDSISVSHLQNQ